jgi:hypothetical protein
LTIVPYWRQQSRNEDSFKSTVKLSSNTYPKDNPDAPLMFYGFGVREDDLTDTCSLFRWAEIHGVDTKEASNSVVCLDDILHQVALALSRECRCSVYLTAPRSLQYDFVIAIARNWTLDKDWKEESIMERARRIIRTAIGEPHQEAKWHYDAIDPKATLLKRQQAARYFCAHYRESVNSPSSSRAKQHVSQER